VEDLTVPSSDARITDTLGKVTARVTHAGRARELQQASSQGAVYAIIAMKIRAGGQWSTTTVAAEQCISFDDWVEVSRTMPSPIAARGSRKLFSDLSPSCAIYSCTGINDQK
jgi:hypothetical protein